MRIPLNIGPLLKLSLNRSRGRASVMHEISLALLAAVLLWLGMSNPVAGAQLPDLYAAEVDMPAGGSLRGAFAAALGSVLLKVTGLPDAGTPAVRDQLFPEPDRLVSQYSLQADDRVWVEFDAGAVRRVLDAAGQPVWGAERPLVAIWYGVDSGRGEREILSSDSQGSGTDSERLDELRTALLDAARERGLPVVLPLMDTEDLAQINFADLWGGFSEPLLTASRRYGAEAVLIGRARSYSPEDSRVRWTLVAGGEQSSWEGSAAAGPRQAAESLARQFATYAGSAGSLRLAVSNVSTLSDYGRLRNYLRSLGIIDGISVIRVVGDTVEFELNVRGDAGRLSRTLEADSRLSPAALPAGAATAGRVPGLVYRWVDRS